MTKNQQIEELNNVIARLRLLVDRQEKEILYLVEKNLLLDEENSKVLKAVNMNPMYLSHKYIEA